MSGNRDACQGVKHVTRGGSTRSSPASTTTCGCGEVDGILLVSKYMACEDEDDEKEGRKGWMEGMDGWMWCYNDVVNRVIVICMQTTYVTWFGHRCWGGGSCPDYVHDCFFCRDSRVKRRL